ncbi:hypothetical protein [Gulosibacter chungangensis]|uniref:Uncharacterized protein n=1 Tax=Gulosibacter chungangensis TaxID=979746 RepID=A0A7J5B9R2_9MICO|nr:hypothetical protein [Gulosibacter chungangensis]KAB1642549.1 hypothetical protein F8O05_08725 [Gulosibacter chungangensis]
MNLPGLRAEAESVLGDPIVPHGSEHRSIRGLRILMAEPDDHADQHLGEAEAITILEHRRIHAVFITDDSKVSKHTNVPCVMTWDLLGIGLVRGIIEPERVRQIRTKLLQVRRVHLAHIRDETQFERWIEEKLLSRRG